MSASEVAIPVSRASEASVWQVRRAQLASIFRLEVKKNFFRWRGAWVLLLAFGPTVIIGAHAIYESMQQERHCNLEEDITVMAAIFQMFYLRLGIFAGCMGIFTRLFRGDMIERTLHYYLLAPVRRELLVVGKWLAGVTAATFFFGMGVLLSFLLMFVHHGQEGRNFLFNSPGPSHLAAYMGATALAVLGYGAIFLLFGMLFKNPIIPAALLLLWETINFVLPGLLKRFSIIFYVQPLSPVEVPVDGLKAMFAVSSDPVSTWLSVPGLLVVTAGILAYTCWRIRRVEIDYGTE